MQAVFEGIGWQVKLRQTRSYHFITLVKEIVLGMGLRKGMTLNYYLVNVEELQQKGVLVLFTEEGIPNVKKVKVNKATFLVKGE